MKTHRMAMMTALCLGFGSKCSVSTRTGLTVGLAEDRRHTFSEQFWGKPCK